MKDDFSGNPWNEFAKKRECLYTVFAHRPGFHGDINLIEIVENFLKKSKYFIETGSYHGCTSYYVSKNFPEIQCFSSEVDSRNYEIASNNCSECTNLEIYREPSPGFIKNLIKSKPELLEATCLFWLDAHDSHRNSGPILEEIKTITDNFQSYYIFVDDVDTDNSPNLEQFDVSYVTQNINLEEINVFEPTYTEKTGYSLTGWLFVTNQQVSKKSKNIKLLKK